MSLILPDVAELSLLEAALEYARVGIPIFPLAQRSKRPIYMGGFNQATVDTKQIEAWWADNPGANIGAVPGRVGCIVPDIDTLEARAAWYERVVIETAATQTGGGVGVHPWYFSEKLAGRSHWRLDEHGGPFQDDRLANLLFRASGGYVVVAPSIHPDTGHPYSLVQPGVPVSQLPSDIERALLAIPSRQAGVAHTADAGVARQWFDEVSKPETSPGGATILKQRLENIANSPKDARNDTLLAEVGVLLNAAYVWPINLDEAREAVREVYVPHVADTRKARDANREVDHAFDYVATQRYWEGPLEEDVGGLPVKPNLKVIQGGLPAPVTPEDRRRALIKDLADGALRLGPLLRGDIPETEWWIDGVIPRRRLTGIVAEAKVGKSLLLLDIAAGLAVGHPILGRAYGPIKILYLDYEMTPEDVAQRLQDMGYQQADSDIVLLDENLHYWQIPPLDPLDTLEGGRLLCEAVEMLEVQLVFVDTLAAAVAGAENDSDTYRAARAHTWAPLKAMGTTVVRVDHLGKDKARGARGSSMKRDDVDLSWELTSQGRVGANDKLLLKRTHSRLHGVAERVDITRMANPLRHVRSGRTVWSTSAVGLARAIISAGVDVAAPGKLTDKLRRAGIVYGNAQLAEARRYIEEGMPPVGPDMTTEATDPRAEAPAPRIPESQEPPPPGKRKLRGLGPDDSIEVT